MKGTAQPARRLVPQPPPVPLTAPARVTSGSVLSEVRATIDAVPRWDDAPIVGRADELGRLLAHVDRAAAGRSSAVLLAGDAGVGKTRLLDELTARAGRARGPGADRALRRPRRRRAALPALRRPAAPGRRRARPRAGLLGQPGAGRAARRPPRRAGRRCRRRPRAATSAARCRTGRRPQPVDDGRLQLFESVAGLICELAASGPLLIVLEDVHWADRSSRDLLRYLLARLVDEPVAVVASYRADDLHRRHPLRPLLAELVRLPGRRADRAGAAARTPRSARWSAAWPRRPAGCRSRPSTTSSPAPRATRSTPRSCWPPGCTARRCRSG